MSRYSLFDRRGMGLRPLVERGHDLRLANVVPLQLPAKLYSHPEFHLLVEATRLARQRERPVIVMLGGHPIKLGLSQHCSARRMMGARIGGRVREHDAIGTVW